MAESSSRECCAYGGPRAGVASGGVRAPRGVRCRERPSPSSRPGRTRQIPMTEEHRRNILWADDEIELLRPHIKFLACKRVFDSNKLQDPQRARDYVGEMQRWQSLDLRGLDWPAWAELAADVARWDVRFDQVPEAGLKQAHQDFRRGLNIDFGRF